MIIAIVLKTKYKSSATSTLCYFYEHNLSKPTHHHPRAHYFFGRPEEPAIQVAFRMTGTYELRKQSLGLPIRMNGMHRARSDHVLLDPLSLVV